MKTTRIHAPCIATTLLLLTLLLITEARPHDLGEVAHYQVINAVGLPGTLQLDLNGNARPHRYPPGAIMSSMGTSAGQITYSGHHCACRDAVARDVLLPSGMVTTVAFFPAITRSKLTGEITRANLEIASLRHPFTRHGKTKTIHLLAVTESPRLPISINGTIQPLRRLCPTAVTLHGDAFNIALDGVRLAHGKFDERDHLACIVFDAPGGGIRAVVFD